MRFLSCRGQRREQCIPFSSFEVLSFCRAIASMCPGSRARRTRRRVIRFSPSGRSREEKQQSSFVIARCEARRIGRLGGSFSRRLPKVASEQHDVSISRISTSCWWIFPVSIRTSATAFTYRGYGFELAVSSLVRADWCNLLFLLRPWPLPREPSCRQRILDSLR